MLNLNQEPQSLIEIFNKFLVDTPSLANTFVYGSERKLQEVLKGIEPESYPVMHLLKPNIITENNQGHNTEFMFICFVSVYSKYDNTAERQENEESEQQADNVCVNVLQEFQKYLNHNTRKDLGWRTELDGQTIDPIMDGFIDRHVGWSAEIKIWMNVNTKIC